MQRMHRVVVPRNAAWRQASADLFGTIEERLAGTEDVRANGAVPYVVHRLLERSRTLLRRQIVAHCASWGTFQVASLLMNLGTVLALAIATALFLAGELTIGTVYLVFAYSESLRRPVEAITRHVQEFQQAAASTGRIRDLLAERSTIVDGPGACLPTGAPSVELDRVTFSYVAGPASPDPSFVRAGCGGDGGEGGATPSSATSRCASNRARCSGCSVGPARARRPSPGCCSASTIPRSAASAWTASTSASRRSTALRARIGIVTQDVQLFHASVRDNVTLFDATVPDARIRAVLLDLGLGPWLDRLPDGLETSLAPGGGGLSAGEAQLLAFARTFLKDPGLIVLDEASSRLDPATERLLERAVDRLLAGRTAIVIAHRLATVQRADRIAILEDGRLVEEGDRVALAADPDSRFGRLLRLGLEDAGVLA